MCPLLGLATGRAPPAAGRAPPCQDNSWRGDVLVGLWPAGRLLSLRFCCLSCCRLQPLGALLLRLGCRLLDCPAGLLGGVWLLPLSLPSAQRDFSNAGVRRAVAL